MVSRKGTENERSRVLGQELGQELVAGQVTDLALFLSCA
jgi:hypothetical protein